MLRFKVRCPSRACSGGGGPADGGQGMHDLASSPPSYRLRPAHASVRCTTGPPAPSSTREWKQTGEGPAAGRRGECLAAQQRCLAADRMQTCTRLHAG